MIDCIPLERAAPVGAHTGGTTSMRFCRPRPQGSRQWSNNDRRRLRRPRPAPEVLDAAITVDARRIRAIVNGHTLRPRRVLMPPFTADATACVDTVTRRPTDRP